LISYAFYLYHATVIAEFAKVHVAPKYPFVLACAAIVTTAVSALSYYGLERPLMRLGRRR
jgi:peptidoglycan/LPS O-acetylase OafA/YrhL